MEWSVFCVRRPLGGCGLPFVVLRLVRISGALLDPHWPNIDLAGCANRHSLGHFVCKATFAGCASDIRWASDNFGMLRTVNTIHPHPLTMTVAGLLVDTVDPHALQSRTDLQLDGLH